MSRSFFIPSFPLPRWAGVIGLLLVSVVLLLPNAAYAAGPDWKQLSQREQTVLKPFKGRWNQYSARTKKTMRTWAGLSSGERATIKKRHAQWRKLGAAKQAKVIRQLDRYKRMPLSKRVRLKAWRQWVKRLPQAEQRQLHKKLPGMNKQQRKAYISQLEGKYGKR